jgi:hypothetical protein
VSASPNFIAGGRAHRMLTRLTLGPASLAQLAQAASAETSVHRRKCWYVVTALLEVEAVVRTDEGYVITAAGRELHDDLEHGTSAVVAKPSVRIFAKPGAAA